MSPERFIARRLRFKGRLALWAIAVSFFVMTVAIAVSAGFRREIRSAVAGIAGDIQIESSFVPEALEGFDGIAQVRKVAVQTGIVKKDDNIQGILLKGVEDSGLSALGVRIPERLSELLGLGVGDPMVTYFVGEDKVRVRKFTVREVCSSPVETDNRMLVYASLEDISRISETDGFSSLELVLEPSLQGEKELRGKALELSGGLYPLVVTSSRDKYSQIFDWLDLIDFNVLAIIVLMTIVAGFNMISGLLILLFRSVPTIGTLKAVGMTDRSIAGVFLRVSARIVALGMLAGNAAALLFCLVQGKTHLLKLNPENYFVSFVPVSVDLRMLLVCDAAAFAAILLLLLIPAMFISKVDPARTVRAA